MNSEQKKYAAKRIASLTNEKIAKVQHEYVIKRYFDLSFEQRYKAVASGKAKLKPFAALNHYTDFKDAYVFPGEKEFNVEQERKQNEMDKRVALVEAECDRLLDLINLGDSDKAMKLIEAFAKRSF